ncbi:hypothetical protein SLE2022_202300 [Rubroshorea leprosula]
MATRTSSSVHSANSAEKHRRKGSLQAVPLGQITRSPSSRSFFIMDASVDTVTRSLLSQRVLMGEMISDSRVKQSKSLPETGGRERWRGKWSPVEFSGNNAN